MSNRKSRVWISKQFTSKVRKVLWGKAHKVARKFGGEPEEVFAEASAHFVAACHKWDESRGPVENWINFYVSHELIETVRRSARRNSQLPRTDADLGTVTVEDPVPFLADDLINNLSADAALVVRLVLKTPKPMMKMLVSRRRKIQFAEPEEIAVRTVLRSFLRDLGWRAERIRSTFGQIADALV